jgi:hypothetical protein
MLAGGLHMRWFLLAVAAALAVSLSLWLTANDDESSGARTAYRDQRAGIEATIPPGWHAIRKPITAVIWPRQVLAAASYPVRLGNGPPDGGCTPQAALAQMPPEGALLEVIEYTPGGGEQNHYLPDLPRRPERFAYADGVFASYECAGPSFRFVFSDRDRAFQAHVWLNRRLVDPRVRAQAIEILNSLRPLSGRDQTTNGRPRVIHQVCFEGRSLLVSGGKGLEAIDQAERRGRPVNHVELGRLARGAFAGSVRGYELRRLERSDGQPEPVIAAAERALAKVQARPELLLDPAALSSTFAETQQLAERGGYSYPGCNF